MLPNDSRSELAKTICEHLGWTTAKGAYRVGACLGMLETLESHGILKLPPKREDCVRDMKAVDAPAWTSASDPQPEIAAELSELRPLRVEPVADTEGRQLWNAFVDRHHYLGHRRPFGAHIRCFVTDRHARRLGCLLFDAVTKRCQCRDRWIGYRHQNRVRHRLLDDLVLQCGDAERSCSAVRLGYFHPPNRRRAVRPPVQPSVQVDQSVFQPFGIHFPRHAIHASGGVTLERVERFCQHGHRDMVQERNETLFRVSLRSLPYPVGLM